MAMFGTTNAGKPKKGVYHSGLAGAGRLAVMFTSETRNSTYAGKPPYVHFKVYGDPSDMEYQLQIEHDRIRTLIDSLPQKVWMWAEAGGSRDDAYLNVMDCEEYEAQKAANGGQDFPLPATTPTENVALARRSGPAGPPPPSGPSRGPATGPASPPAQRSGPPTQQQNGNGHHVNANGNGHAAPPARKALTHDLWLCLEAAADVVREWNTRHVDAPLVLDPATNLREIATTLFIEFQRSGGTRVIHVKPKQQPAAAAPEPEPAAAGTAPGGPFAPDDEDLPF